jgi:hypothetical protein
VPGFDRTLLDKSEALAIVVSKELCARVRDGAYMVKKYAEEWTEANPFFTEESLLNVPDLRARILKAAEIHKHVQKGMYEAYLKEWRDRGVRV